MDDTATKIDVEREIYDLIGRKLPEINVEVEIKKDTKDGVCRISSFKVSANDNGANLRASTELHNHTDESEMMKKLENKIDGFINESESNRISAEIAMKISEAMKSIGFEVKSTYGSSITVNHSHSNKLFEINVDMKKLRIRFQYKVSSRFGVEDEDCYFMELADPKSLDEKGILDFIREMAESEADKKLKELRGQIGVLQDAKGGLPEDDLLAHTTKVIIPGWEK